MEVAAYELTHLYYDREFLRDHMLSIPQFNWYEFNCGFIRWTVHEEFNPRLECKNYPWSQFHQELFQLFDPPIMPDTMLYTKTPVGGTPPHQDRNRKCVLNFAIDGIFGDSSPQTFYTDFDKKTEVAKMPYTTSPVTGEFAPWFFKGSEIHGVENIDDPDRCILSVCWRHHEYEEIVERLHEGTLVNERANNMNRLVRFV